MPTAKKPYVQFIGNSSIDVTGSCHKVRFADHTILLDCGLIQTMDLVSSYRANREFVKAIKPKEVQAIVLSHVHIDHSGLIPYMIKRNSSIKVIVPHGSTKLLKLLWEDSAKIMMSDCEKLSRKNHMRASALYSLEDVMPAVHNCVEIDFNRPINLFEDVIMTYKSAGHIVSSAQILLELKEGANSKYLGYTGDIGGYTPQIYVEDREPLPFADVLIGECTYAKPSRKNSKKDRDKDIEKLLMAIDTYKKILIPCFSLQRSQQFLKLFWDLGIYGKIKVYVDSPLCQKFCNIWEDSNEWHNIMSMVTFIDSTDDSKKLQARDEHCIILSASGFMTGGRVIEHLKTVLPDSHNAVLFVGYCGDNGLAFDVKEGKKKKVSVEDTVVKNNAKIIELRSFSSHANYEDLMKIYQEYRFNKLCLVHSNMDDKVEFAKTLKEKLAKQGIASKVLATNKDDKIFI